ncbi:MAG TPA: hypothetical protein VFM05_01575 [Candidatus Saccharimonadales bacterium]|nr:hypothetical protein [Candidatus Saccharimonadales bacterium]
MSEKQEKLTKDIHWKDRYWIASQIRGAGLLPSTSIAAAYERLAKAIEDGEV